MRIGVDAGCLGITDERLKVGVYQVVRHLLVELGKDTKDEYLLYSFYPIDKDVMKEFGPHMKNIVVRPTTGWLKIALPLRLLFDKPQVFLALNQATPTQYFFSTYKVLGIVYDVAFKKFPSLYSSSSHHKLETNTHYLLEHAEKIITISQTTKDDVSQLYGVDKKMMVVSYPGFQKLPHETMDDRKGLHTPFFLFVGAHKKSKNIPTLIKAFGELGKKHPTYSLYLVGGNKWPDTDIKKALDALPADTQHHIFMLGHVSTKMLSALYHHAQAFVSPSWYEGFGLPFLEAMESGCPVIGSTAGSIPEIVGDAGILVDPKNVEELVWAMEKMTQESVRNTYKKKGKERSKRYAWKTFANSIQSAIDTLQ